MISMPEQTIAGSGHFPRDVPFKPSPAFVPWFLIGFTLLIALLLVVLFVPLYLAGALDTLTGIIVLAGILVFSAIFVVWTKLYYASMFYEIHDDELRWRRGVWFRTTGIVPYNRITNLDLKQGPLMRFLNISTISIQTAGYSGQAVPEIRIEAIEHAEELRELLRNLVRSCSGAGDGTGTGRQPGRAAGEPGAPAGTSILILDELKKIRVLLEQQRR